MGLIIALPGYYLASFIGKLATDHAEQFGKKIKSVNVSRFLSKLVQPIVIFIVVISAIHFFPPEPTAEQKIKHLATSLNRSEKIWLTFGFQSKYKGIPENAVRVQGYMNELGNLPQDTIAVLYTTSHQSLATKGLIEDLPLKRGEKNNQTTLTVKITDLGEKVFFYLEKNSLF